MATIVVGVDGSPDSQRALAWAVEEAELRGTPLQIVAVQPIPRTLGWGGVPLQVYPEDEDRQRVEAGARQALDKVTADREGPLTVPVTVEAVIGDAIEELLAAGNDADLLAVGSRGAGGFSRLLLGSVSTALVHHADCPVVVVRPPREQP